MEAKYVLFSIALLVGVPIGIMVCLIRPAITKLVLIVLVWATCEPNMVGINFASREFYRANTRGFELTLADLCTLVLMGFMLVKRQDYPIRWFPPLTLPTLGYLLVGLISWTMTGPSLAVPPEAVHVPYTVFEVGLYPLFELLKIVRGFLLYWAIVNYVRDEQAARELLIAIAVAALYMGYLAITSRYLHGVNRVQATLGHPNSLATYMAMLGSFSFAFVLQSSTLFPSLMFGILTLLCMVSVILTISRGGLGALFLGLWLNTVVLLPRHLSLKNMAILLMSVLMVGIMLFVAMDTLMARFSGEQDAGADLAYRGKYNAEAKMMAHDHVWGVGLGNFSAWSWERYAEQVDPDLSPGTPAHNNWYLTLGEMGVPGVIALAIFWIRYFLLAAPFYLRVKKDTLSTMAMAGCTAVIVDQLQSLLQLGYRQTPMYFMMMIFVGVTVAAWYARREQSTAKPLTETASPQESI
ncbi:MAG: O-antigen ligase family protein [Kiritimatiellales bacterium]